MRKLSLLAAAALLSAGLSAQRLNPCSFLRIAPTCGPVLSGSDRIVTRGRLQFHYLNFKVTRAPRGAKGILAFGLKQARRQIPGTRCFLLVQPIVFLPFSTNRIGEASLSVAVPGRMALSLLLQSGHASGRTVVTSNGLRMGCR